MILIDKDIEQLLVNGVTVPIGDPPAKQTAIYNGDNDCITNIGYDLCADTFSKSGKMVKSVELQPGESTFVKSKEIIAFDSSTIGKIILKNSRIRMGLSIDAPVYQPGHITNIYFRVTNISRDTVVMNSGEQYAMLMFEQLEKDPNSIYSGTFQQEFSFKGLADYKSAYADQIQSLDGKVKDINDIEKRIYNNVITIMTVLIAVFSILNLNVSLLAKSTSLLNFITYNLSTLGAFSFLAILLDTLINRKGQKTTLWLIPGCCFLVMIILLFFK